MQRKLGALNLYSTGGAAAATTGNHSPETNVAAVKTRKTVSTRIWNTLSRKPSKTQQQEIINNVRNSTTATTILVPQAEEKDKEMIEQPPRKSVSCVEIIEPRKSVSHVEMIEPRKSVSRIEMIGPARKSVSNNVEVMIDSRKSVSHVEMNVKSVAAFLNVKVIAVDMPGFIQVHAFRCARRTYDGLDKFSSKHMAYNMKKEFDRVYGPAWHCIVGSSFGSFVTHSTGFFIYFSIEKIFILIFKTKVQRSLG